MRLWLCVYLEWSIWVWPISCRASIFRQEHCWLQQCLRGVWQRRWGSQAVRQQEQAGSGEHQHQAGVTAGVCTQSGGLFGPSELRVGTSGRLRRSQGGSSQCRWIRVHCWRRQCPWQQHRHQQPLRPGCQGRWRRRRQHSLWRRCLRDVRLWLRPADISVETWRSSSSTWDWHVVQPGGRRRRLWAASRQLWRLPAHVTGTGFWECFWAAGRRPAPWSPGCGCPSCRRLRLPAGLCQSSELQCPHAHASRTKYVDYVTIMMHVSM